MNQSSVLGLDSSEAGLDLVEVTGKAVGSLFLGLGLLAPHAGRTGSE
ncbi:hypothetical protein [Streptomyces flavofungini]|nr:hypothetical protein [Streptomyces flavofungini]WJV49909.1 hypothetical protein QUY26_32930 [Streptomyces flavofungini]